MTVEEQIKRKLIEGLNPSHLEVINESHLHKGHAGDNGSGESHFKLKVASDKFQGKSKIERNRIVFQLLEDEIKKIHALSVEVLF